jgi:solute carrier family 32 (vesicular inhibitory amino acid transporter)
MRKLLDSTIRILVLVVMVVIAIAFPSFDVIMSFLGSCLCFTICVILPVAFYLKTFHDVISTRERILDWVLIIVCSILAVIGTVFAFIPREKLGIK